MNSQERIQEIFNEIAGYESIKKDAMGVVDMLIREEEYLASGARFPKGFLLYGKPGMGKTKVVKAISKASEVPLLEVSEAEGLTKGVNIDKLIVDTFAQAHEIGKCIIFIDEIDKFAGYDKWQYDVPENLNTQKILMQAIDAIGREGKSIVIATANDLRLLSDTLLRTGRFDRMLQFHLPEEGDRKAIFDYYTRQIKLDDSVDIQGLVLDTAGCSCADIECIANEAVINSVQRRGDTITTADIISAMKRVTLRDIPKTIDLDNSERLKATAYHEAGHAFISLYYKKHIINASIIPQGSSTGSILNRSEKDDYSTKESLEQTVRVAIAGGIATEVFLGKRMAGCVSDLAKAQEIINGMCEEGFYGYENCQFQSSVRRYGVSDTLEVRRHDFVVSVLSESDKIVRFLMEEHREEITRIAEALIDRKQLDYQELVALMQNS